MDFARQFGEEAAELEVFAPRNEHFEDSLCVGGMPTKHAVSLIWERLRAFQQVRGGRDALQLFRTVDENKDGFVKPDEFLAFLQQLNVTEVTRHIAKAAIKAADANRGGKLDYEELLGVVAEESSSSSDSDSSESTKPSRKEGEGHVLQDLKIETPHIVESKEAIWRRMHAFAQEAGGLKALQLFQTFDRDGDGKITVREFRSALTMVGIQGVPLHEVRALLATVDLDGDGRLSYEEFLTALTESASDDDMGGGTRSNNGGGLAHAARTDDAVNGTVSSGGRSRSSAHPAIANQNSSSRRHKGYAPLDTREEENDRPASSPRSMSMESGETPTFSPPPPSRRSAKASPEAAPPQSSPSSPQPHSSPAHRSKSKTAASSPTKGHSVSWQDGVSTGDDSAASAAAATDSSNPGPVASSGSKRSSGDGSSNQHRNSSRVDPHATTTTTTESVPRGHQLLGRLPPRVLKQRGDGPPPMPDSHEVCESRLLEMHELSRLLKDGKASNDDLARYRALLLLERRHRKAAESGGLKSSSGLLGGDAEDDDDKAGRNLKWFTLGIVVFFFLGLADSFTTKFAKRGSVAFAGWTMRNAPLSFAVYVVTIVFLICACLPYGPLSLLMGVVFTSVYGFKMGVALGFVTLFVTTMVAGLVCFNLARDHFKGYVQRKIDRTQSLRTLKNLDRLIVEGQGFEMVLLIRLAPLPTGPSQYFLGTTSVSWWDFWWGNAATNSVFAFTDIMIGAGASTLRVNNPVGIGAFLFSVVGFFVFVGWVGYRAKKKLDRIEEEEAFVRKSLEMDIEDLMEMESVAGSVQQR